MLLGTKTRTKEWWYYTKLPFNWEMKLWNDKLIIFVALIKSVMKEYLKCRA